MIKNIKQNIVYEGFEPDTRKDYGLLMKIRNPKNKEQYIFVCAGEGEWGTSGATWYLSTKWKELYKKYKNKEFGLVVEVSIGADTSAVIVYESELK